MHEEINEKVSVIMLYDRNRGIVQPIKIRWQGRSYRVNQVGYHHKTREGRVVIHVFSVLTDTLAMRLEFNTETLHWNLAEVSDGLAS